MYKNLKSIDALKKNIYIDEISFTSKDMHIFSVLSTHN